MFKKILGKLIFVAVAASLFSGCMPKAKIDLYKRDDIDTSNSQVIVFPLLLKTGGDFAEANKNYDNKSLDSLVVSDWSSEIGTDDVIVVPKAIINEIPKGWEVLGKIVKILDSTSAIEQSLNNPEIKQFTKELSSKLGDGALGFAIVFQDEDSYEATKILQGNMGLFDTKSLTWKWITKYRKEYKLPIPYEVAVKELFSASWEKLKSENNGNIK